MDKERAELVERGVDSGFTPENIADAEWMWTNLPTGMRKFHNMLTYERALVCHTVARFRENIRTADAQTIAALRAEVERLWEREKAAAYVLALDADQYEALMRQALKGTSRD